MRYFLVAGAACLAGCVAEPCQPSTDCEGQTFVRCVDDVPELVDCAATGRICSPDLSDIHNIVPACMTIGVPPGASVTWRPGSATKMLGDGR